MMRIKKFTFMALASSLSMYAFAGPILNSPVNTAMITKNVIEAALKNPFGNYVNYHIEGMCFWMHWGMFGPYVTQTLKVNEFLPDAIVDVYTNEGKNPWGFVNSVIDPASKAIGDATSTQIDGMAPKSTNDSLGGGNNMMEKFKEVDIIGDPALPVFFSKIPKMMIPSEATPWMTYYSSLADSYFWHDPMIDDITHIQDMLPDVRTEGSAIDQWGNIFPRIGFINQLGDYKAASVLALRAADIATNSDQSHIYYPLHSGSCGSHCTVWPSHENDFADVKYQEIYPNATITAKKVFGVNDTLSGTYGQSQYSKGKGNYVWVMWRHYHGCIQGGGRFLWET